MGQLSKREQNRIEKQDRILRAALRVFADVGFTRASMDQIAIAAQLSKPTLYSYYASKDALFEAMMTAPRDSMMLAFDTAGDKELVAQLRQFAWAYADIVMHPDYLSLARLTIGEAHRFPEIGRLYQERGPDKVLAGLMGFMVAHKQRGHLKFDDAELAAEDFWGLILSAPRNRALHVPDLQLTKIELARYINNGLRTFLRAYSSQPERDLARLGALLAMEDDRPGLW